MDDIKLFVATEIGLKRQLTCLESFSNDIRMSLGLQKCKIHTIKRGIWHATEDFQLTRAAGGGVIQGMAKDEAYKYLGFAQSGEIQAKQVKQKLAAELLDRSRAVLKTQLSALHTITAINSYAIPVVAWSFGVIKWSTTELDDLNRTMRVCFTKFRKHLSH
ncbi:hypothetical protein NQ315_016082 [Exocentrus adspersus]|uniref:Uncharacterized protein n=1 Tax=Exocentrus adspersus TaxID=1586481 RepID=A0AAV8VKY5_9CUCU|nr:hypothetical protein NQ315_016082 [Exocentrus adspersus]